MLKFSSIQPKLINMLAQSDSTLLNYDFNKHSILIDQYFLLTTLRSYAMIYKLTSLKTMFSESMKWRTIVFLENLAKNQHNTKTILGYINVLNTY